MENVLITGITGGIGYAVAEKLLENGSSVLGVARNTQADRNTLSSKYGDRVHTVDFDLMQVEAVDDLIKIVFHLVERPFCMAFADRMPRRAHRPRR